MSTKELRKTRTPVTGWDILKFSLIAAMAILVIVIISRSSAFAS